MATPYEAWITSTTATVFDEIRKVAAIAEALRHLKGRWAIPSNVMTSTPEPDREAARADAIHRGYQAMTAAELDAEALLRSLRAVIYRLERGERPFTLPDIEGTIPEPEPLRLDPIEP